MASDTVPTDVSRPRAGSFTWRGGTGGELVASYLAWRGVRRVYGLCGGHIQPIWDALARLGVSIVDVRHECAAVYMAHAEADLTGNLAVALVTAGPGLTNTVTGIANASQARVPLLLLSGRPPRPQAGRGALQEINQAAILTPLCRATLTAEAPRQVLPRLDEAMMAAYGWDAPPGPAYMDFPTDLLTEQMAPGDLSMWRPTSITPPEVLPAAEDLARARKLIAEARRPIIIGGRGARAAGRDLATLVENSGILYLDSGESRGALPMDHPNAVSAARGRAMREADLVITLDRSLNYQLAYGSAAVFHPGARFLRVGRHSAQVTDNRRGDVELICSVPAFLAALSGADLAPDLDTGWADSLRASHRAAVHRLAEHARTVPAGADGLMHPYRLLAAVNDLITDDTVVVADGGDILSFARVALAAASTYLDCGPFGCLGVGVPFANAAALTHPGRRVLAVVGDGSFGFTAMEIDTAVRHQLGIVCIIANNQAWNIEKTDQLKRFAGNAVGVDLPGCRYDLLARSLGAAGRRITDPTDLQEALAWALGTTPAVLDVLVTQDAESPDSAAGLATVPSLQPLTKWQQAEEIHARAR
ncbi:thiamine pyrophosphate-binding protein [Mycobacterium sp. SM1]|uniref:thiamine pyrophosphate-binding protein n=1 Tax=Mycobacterium sp. SM1 TaxID=2816243 RepID=UPI001BCB5E50|nr:thiamine pyrophosphate-binding protein [Mycobacterium sp. SM1]MBS4730409.1 thiamine pyrophosphate-binding protein [Mycobacterium sp. SM1]